MNPPEHPNITMTRRACLVWLGSTLSACGGGGGGLANLAPGTGGTGSPIYAQGAISGFGSVIVNGVKFDDTQATVHLDGVAAQSTDLRLGMVAGVQGQRSATDVTLGTAEVIEVWSIALGPIERVMDGHFVMLGMTIQTDTNTLLEGISSVAALTPSQTVSVWGLQVDADGTQWRATRVKLETTSVNRVATGLVKRSDDEATLNGLDLSGELAEDLPTGVMVRVNGTLKEDGSLRVSGRQVLNSGIETYADGVIELEGFVTSSPANNRFMMGNITVDASNPALSTVVSQLAIGQEVEVYGSWSSGVLLASRIALEGDQSKGIEIEATIDQFTSVADFVLRGQRCDASAATFEGGRAADLAVGIKIQVKGTIAGNVLKVTELEFDD